MFPEMGEMTVISIVLQLLKTISDGDLLVSRRRLMLVGSLKIFIQLKFTTVNDFISTVYSSNYWISFCEDIYFQYTKPSHWVFKTKMLPLK